MIASLLILTIGLTDVARSLGRRPDVRWATVALVWAGVAVVAVWGLGVPVLGAAGCVALAAGWAFVMALDDRPRPRRLWPVVVLLLIVAGVTVYDDTTAGASGFLVDAYAAVRLPALDGVSLRTALAAVAVGVFLTTSGNIVARAALGRAEPSGSPSARVGQGEGGRDHAGHGGGGRDHAGQGAGGRDHAGLPAAAAAVPGPTVTRAWVLRVAGRVVGTVESPRGGTADDALGGGAGPAHDEATGLTLRGGRLIGPLERILVVVLGLGGAYAVIAAVLAAKGIVRFPEISEDRRTGSKAEEFLIGSLASWSVSTAAIVYLNTLAYGL
ncbi:MAG: hypothetical protein ACYC1Z_07375 [Georgenia sp.]